MARAALEQDIFRPLDDPSVGLLKEHDVLGDVYAILGQPDFAGQIECFANMVAKVSSSRRYVKSTPTTIRKTLANEIRDLLFPRLEDIQSTVKAVHGLLVPNEMSSVARREASLLQQLSEAHEENKALRSAMADLMARRLSDPLRIPAYAEVHGSAAERKFQALAEEWRSQRSISALIFDVTMSAPYQRIIGMGPVAVPLILEDLKQQVDAWFWALAAVTGADPVPEEDSGHARKMAEYWISWGQARGIIS